MKKLASHLPNLLLLLVSTGFSLLVLEAIVRLADLWPRERAAARGELAAYEEPETGSDETPELSQVVIHPFLGWSGRPRSSGTGEEPMALRVTEDQSEEWTQRNQRRNVVGFHSFVVDPRQLRREDFVVGIFGGSVALGLALYGGDAIVRRLEEHRPELEGSIYVLNMAKGGYKQPQQLFAFQQMLMLGVPFDVVVNLDGFNELAVSSADAMDGYHPLFPQRTRMATTLALGSDSFSPQEIEVTADLLRQKREYRRLEQSLDRSPWGGLELVRAFRGRQVLAARTRLVVLEEELRRLAGETRGSDFSDLQDPCLGQGLRCMGLSAKIWKRSSQAMAATADRFGVQYLHLLQPNQYVEGSKPLSEEEKELFYDPNRRWSQAVIRGYALLQKEGRALKRRGVDFHDLTQVFVDHPETLYRDACCHFNPRGNQLLGRAVADLLADRLKK